MTHKTHVLKTDSAMFNDVVAGKKTFEVRVNDRDFERGDIVVLEEFTPVDLPTGASASFEIGYLVQGVYGLSPELCVFSLVELESTESTDAVDELIAYVSGLRDALLRVQHWINAYPEDVFPEPDMKRVHEVLTTHRLSLAQVSASNMRHVLKGLEEIIKKALGDTDDVEGNK